MKLVVLSLSFAALVMAADVKLVDLAQNATQLRSKFKDDDLTKGLAYLSDHEEVLFAIDTYKTPSGYRRR